MPSHRFCWLLPRLRPLSGGSSLDPMVRPRSISSSLACRRVVCSLEAAANSPASHAATFAVSVRGCSRRLHQTTPAPFCPLAALRGQEGDRLPNRSRPAQLMFLINLERLAWRVRPYNITRAAERKGAGFFVDKSFAPSSLLCLISRRRKCNYIRASMCQPPPFFLCLPRVLGNRQNLLAACQARLMP